MVSVGLVATSFTYRIPKNIYIINRFSYNGRQKPKQSEKSEVTSPSSSLFCSKDTDFQICLVHHTQPTPK